MTKPDNKSKLTPTERWHAIMYGNKKRELPADRLPKAKPATVQPVPLPHVLPPSAPAVPKETPVGSKVQILPAFWTIASVISMIVNIVLIAALLVVLRSLGGLNLGQVGTGLVGGLYSNFERMDAAHIKTTIPIDAIQLNTSIPVQKTTNIVLADAAEIPNAHVKIATGTFNIDSDADVILPAGTTLNITLNFDLPVQQSVPIDLKVPVDIALNATELHPALSGLENTIKPLYCAFNPYAISIHNAPVCR